MISNGNEGNSWKTPNSLPIIVDLDDTFLNSDLLVEAFIVLLKKNPFYIFPCLLWLIRGKYFLKENIFKRVEIDYTLVPVNKELKSFLELESANGRKIILATGSLQNTAYEIGKLYPVFNEIHGSIGDINLVGRKKSNFLIEKYGQGQFDYIGNSKADLEIFDSCRIAYLVNPSKSVEGKVIKTGKLKKCWRTKKSMFLASIQSIRIYQWVKNILLFVPLFTSHSYNSFDSVIKVIVAFFAFSFIASAGYVINDLMDINGDRTHTTKKNRPFASGNLSLLSGFTITCLLIIAGIYLSSLLNGTFMVILILYFFLSVGYSIHLKKIVLYDVFLLATFYTMRVISGGIVTDISLSFWLIAFSIFIFLSLAFIKRYSEIIQVTHTKNIKKNRRDYSFEDIPLLQIMGVASGFLSAIVFSLYINSPDVELLYAYPKLLWLLCLLQLFWICRVWLVTSRGEMTDDPIIFTLKDPVSYVIIFLTAIILAFSMYPI